MLSRILLAGLLAATLAFAQRGGGGGRGGGGMPSGGFSAGSRLDHMTDFLKLSKDQRKEVKAALDEAQKEAVPVHELMTQSRLSIAEAIVAGKSQEEIDKAVQKQAELDAQLASIELHAFAKAVSVLEQEQKQRGIPLLFNMVRGLFNGKNWNSD